MTRDEGERLRGLILGFLSGKGRQKRLFEREDHA